MKIITSLSKRLIEKFTTAQTLLLGYLLLMLLGGAVLMLPASLKPDIGLSFLDALFTSASAITGAGLTVVDTGSSFSFFGIGAIYVLIQVGNIGYMMFFALAVLLFGKKLSLANKMMLKESISISDLGLVVFVQKVFKYTMVIQGISTVFLMLYWVREYSFIKALGMGLFFSASSFCTAGFSVFGDSVMSYSSSGYINLVLLITSYLGACGFFVLYDLSMYFKNKLRKEKEIYRLSIHSRLVLVITFCLLFAGTLLVYTFENLLNPVGHQESLLEAFFQVGSASSTVGLNSTDISHYNYSSLLVLMMLMFIGASPSGTGGGIKSTVFAITLFSLYTFLADRKQMTFFKRSIDNKTIARASSISFLAFGWFFLTLIILTISDPELSFIHLAFEAVSANACNGLSTGVTASLSDLGKFVIIISILIGRVGPLVVGYSLIGRTERVDFEYPKGNVLIV